jgi:hypothetical protein
LEVAQLQADAETMNIASRSLAVSSAPAAKSARGGKASRLIRP